MTTTAISNIFVKHLHITALTFNHFDFCELKTTRLVIPIKSVFLNPRLSNVEGKIGIVYDTVPNTKNCGHATLKITKSLPFSTYQVIGSFTNRFKEEYFIIWDK